MYRSESCDVTWLEELNVAFVVWKKFCCHDNYRKPLMYALNILKNHNNCHYVADTRNGFENEPADTQWVFDYFIPQAALTTCGAVFFIIDNDNKLKDELDGQSAELKKQFDVHYCFGLDEVKAIIESGNSFKRKE